MMASFKWNIDGFREIRTSPEMQDEIHSLADELATAAGNGYAVKSRQGTGAKARFGAIVFAYTSRAYGDQLRNNTLQKVLFARKGAE